MELSARLGITTNMAAMDVLPATVAVNGSKLTNGCAADAGIAATSTNHHFLKRINEPSKGQQAPSGLQTAQHMAHQQQQQEQKQMDIDGLSSATSSPKPNQVGTVLLYGIPIVSLYIESQERLCLAQISNTLLKQFSYNEIHNRRVALGITCVQCTPVQLEILRRAGAMPVSSRRCGMITRREAERLCKSFLGDNAPPRLPEDFAFSVHHKCAWGCRGSFLPSRYNSSRAKCIKCFYCGLFFSPNKFIFHSHRIGPGDSYVQPDAANFNSWRRHMKLSGSPPEEIIHAWEDVKAMFNGGTRKRLMATGNSTTSLTSVGGGRSSASTSTTAALAPTPSSSSSTSSTSTQSPKRLKENSPGRSAPGSSAMGQFPLMSLNIHHHPGNTNGQSSSTNPVTSLPGVTSPADIALPFSRNFMIDYMWHAHAQNKGSSNHFHFPNYTIPWIKNNPGSFIFGNNSPNATTVPGSSTEDPVVLPSNGPETLRNNKSPNTGNSIEGFGSPTHNYITVRPEMKSLSGFYNNSAFKPVIQVNRPNLALDAVAAVAVVAAAAANSYDGEQKTLSRATTASSLSPSPSGQPIIKESFSSDDEMVDIETTEEEEKPFDSSQQRGKFSKKDDPEHVRLHMSDELDAPIEVTSLNSDDLPWNGLMKREQTTKGLGKCRTHTPTSSLLSHSPVSSIASESHIPYMSMTKSSSSTPDVIQSGSPRPARSSSGNLDHRTNCSPDHQRHIAAAIASAFSQNHQHKHSNHSQNQHQHQHPHHQHNHQSVQQLQHHHHNQQQQSQQHHPPSQLSQPPTNASSIVARSPMVPTSLVTGRLATDNNILFNAIAPNGNSSKTNSSLLLATNNNLPVSNSDNTNNNRLVNGVVTIPNSVNNDFWSVAQFSLNRPNSDYSTQYRLPITAAFHRHHYDITKHFQVFRHQGHETQTQTNGVG